MHISDLSWTKKIRHPSEVVKKNDEIEVIVLGINRDERRIALGHKQIEDNPWDAFEDSYKVDTETKGNVARIIDKGVIVTLPLGVDGFIPITHLGHPKLKKATEYYNIGDEIPAKVIEFDKENKKIVLSVTNYFKDKEEKDLAGYLAGQGVEKTTLQDLVKDVPEDLAKKKPADKEKTSAKKSEEMKEESKKTEEPKAKVPDQTEEVKAKTKPAENTTPEKKETKTEEPEAKATEKTEDVKADSTIPEKKESKADVPEEKAAAEEKPAKEKKTKVKKETEPETEKKTKPKAKKTSAKKKDDAADSEEKKEK